MKLFLSIIPLFITSLAYSQLDFYNCPIKGKMQYAEKANLNYNIVFSGKDTAFYSWKIDTGSFIVFHYSQDYSCDPTFHEAVYTSLFWSIPIPQASFSFQFSNIDSLTTPLIYKTGCGPPCRKYNFDLTDGSGVISGHQISENTWKIKAQLKLKLLNRSKNIYAEKELSFDDTFVLWKQKKKDRKYHLFYGF